LNQLLTTIRGCEICKDHLPLGPRPVLSANAENRILIVGQAPGTAVHKSGIPWDDPSGRNLRRWMGINDETFYNHPYIGIVPMGFCYPGKGKTGDLPPRKECAPTWHDSLLELMPNVKLMLLIGKYAQDYYLGKSAKKNLTETVMHFDEYLPNYFVLPHPSPRNNIWMKRNDWFEEAVLPDLKVRVAQILTS